MEKPEQAEVVSALNIFSHSMDIHPVEIRPVLPGFQRFISLWLIRDETTMLVDVGPAAGAEGVIRDLESLGVDRLDLVLLTHIHMDHCGALARVLERFPGARVICHDKAVSHLVDPDRLWQATCQVLGRIGRAYGAPGPVPGKRLIPHSEAAMPDLEVLETPGHAVHHLSFWYKGALFAGEAGGNYLRLGDEDYLRPATPPKLLLDVFLESLDRLASLEDAPLYYAHFGAADSSRRWLGAFREQVSLWMETISGRMTRHGGEPVEGCVADLMEADPLLKALRRMEADMRERERFFITNSVKGFIGYLRERS